MKKDRGIISEESGGTLVAAASSNYDLVERADVVDYVSSMSAISFMSSYSPVQLYPVITSPQSDEYKEFLRWKKRREEEKQKQEEPPPLEPPLRLIELEK